MIAHTKYFCRLAALDISLVPKRSHSELVRRRSRRTLSSSIPCLVSPANYLRCFYTLRSVFEKRGAELEARKALYSSAIAKFEEVEKQARNLPNTLVWFSLVY